MINNDSNCIRTRLPSGYVLEITPGPSDHRLIAARPVDQNLCQYFVVTEVPDSQESYTIENAAATGTYSVFLELTRSSKSASLTVTASSRRLDDNSQEWKLTVVESVNDCDYYVIQNVCYPGNVLALGQKGVIVKTSSQSPRSAVNQQWALIPEGARDTDPFPDGRDDNKSDSSAELQGSEDEDKVAELIEEIEEKDLLLKDKDQEISQLKERLKALSVSRPSRERERAPAPAPVPVDPPPEDLLRYHFKKSSRRQTPRPKVPDMD